MMTIRDVRFFTNEFLEMWAVAHQNHPWYEGGPKQGLWLYALAKRRARLEMALAIYRTQKVRLEFQGGLS